MEGKAKEGKEFWGRMDIVEIFGSGTHIPAGFPSLLRFSFHSFLLEFGV